MLPTCDCYNYIICMQHLHITINYNTGDLGCVPSDRPFETGMCNAITPSSLLHKHASCLLSAYVYILSYGHASPFHIATGTLCISQTVIIILWPT